MNDPDGMDGTDPGGRTGDDEGTPSVVEASLDGTLTFRLMIPDDWEITPTEPNEFRQWLSERLTQIEGMDRDEIARIQSSLGTRMVEAASQGLVSAAVYAQVIGDEDAQRLLMASLAVTLQTLESEEGGLSIPTLLMTLANLESEGDIQLTEEPLVLDMGRVSAVRTVGIEEESGADADVYSANVTVAYRAPLGDGRSLLSIALSTPCFWLLDELVPLFDAIAQTFELEIPEGLVEPV